MKLCALFLSIILVCGIICGCKEKSSTESVNSEVSSVTSVANEVPAMA